MAAESLPAFNVTTALADIILGLDQCVVQPSVISLHVVMLGELEDGTTKGVLAYRRIGFRLRPAD